jgi:hypothetical protein
MAWRESTSMSVDGFDDNDSEKDETKRKSRNLSEKKRRDQVREVCSNNISAAAEPANFCAAPASPSQKLELRLHL